MMYQLKNMKEVLPRLQLTQAVMRTTWLQDLLMSYVSLREWNLARDRTDAPALDHDIELPASAKISDLYRLLHGDVYKSSRNAMLLGMDEEMQTQVITKIDAPRLQAAQTLTHALRPHIQDADAYNL